MKRKIYSLFFSVFVVSGCSNGGYGDLVAFMAQVKATPAGRIEPIPAFNPYKPFDYSVTSKRAPFDKPVIIAMEDLVDKKLVDPPSPTRPKELLEQSNIESLEMVGTYEQHSQLWALLKDQNGGIHNVKTGNYLGRNNGKIITTTSSYIQVLEVVTNGSGGWVERPRTIELREKE